MVPFILGIPLWYYFPKAFDFINYFIPGLIVLQFLTSYIPKLYPAYRWRYFSTGIIYLLFFLLGVLSAKNYFPYQNANYFSSYLTESAHILAKVIDSPSETKKSYKMILEIKTVVSDTNYRSVLGKAIVYIPKDSLAPKPKNGDLIIFKNKLAPLLASTNPESFDYKSFMSRKGIQFSAFLKKNDFLIMPKEPSFSIKNLAIQIRDKLLFQLQKTGLEGEEYAIAASLILGYQEALTDDLVTSYRSAGVMHILCVSGMHVGILFMILSQLFGFLKHIKGGITIRLIIIILNIWLFAFITGLSPSVTRAAVMFTFVAIGKNIKRDINIYNTLSASALLTLVIEPFSLFEIGFQLSYIAVIAIAALYKPIYSLWVPRWKVPDYLWQIMAVSLAAQIGTAPLSMFYFHQFPNYFLASNLVVILLVTPIFYLALATILLSFVPLISHWLAFLTTYSIKLMNFLVGYFQLLPYSLTEGISFGPFFLLLLILLIVFGAIMLIGKNKNLIFINFGIAILMLLSSFHQDYKRNQIFRFIQFDTPGKTALLIQHGRESVLLVDSNTFKNPESIDFQWSGYKIKNGLNPNIINLDQKGSQINFFYRKDNFITIDKTLLALYADNQKYKDSINCDFLIIRNKKAYDLEKALINFKPKTIVFSNELWDNQKEKLLNNLTDDKVKIHDIAKDGALIINL